MTLASLPRLFTWAAAGGGPLKDRVLRGGMWLLIADVATRAMGLVKMAVLARLLAPGDFGLMGLATIVLSWFEYFTQTGFNVALIQKSGDIKPYLNTFFTVQFLRGIGVAAVLVAGAPLGGWFFHNPGVTSVIRAIAATAFLRGLVNPAVIHLRRDLNIRRDIAWRLGGAMVGFVVAIPVALVYRTVWALVLSVIAAAAAEAVLSYCVLPYRPRLELHRDKARELIRFAKWVFWFNAAYYFSLYADSWVVGRFLGAATVGFYQVAQQFGTAPLAQLGAHISAVMLPAFSKLRDGGDLRAAFLRAWRLMNATILPAACFVTVFAEPLVRLVLGPRWTAVPPLLRILTWAGAMIALGGLTAPFLQAAGRPDSPTRAVFVKVLTFAALVYPLMLHWGATGVALAAFASGPVNVLYQYILVVRTLRWDWDLLLVFRPAALACAPFLFPALLRNVAAPAWVSLPAACAATLVSLLVILGQVRAALHAGRR